MTCLPSPVLHQLFPSPCQHCLNSACLLLVPESIFRCLRNNVQRLLEMTLVDDPPTMPRRVTKVLESTHFFRAGTPCPAPCASHYAYCCLASPLRRRTLLSSKPRPAGRSAWMKWPRSRLRLHC